METAEQRTIRNLATQIANMSIELAATKAKLDETLEKLHEKDVIEDGGTKPKAK